MPNARYRRQYAQRRSPVPRITLTDEARTILQLLESTREPVFLTGRAGTGKSTLLQYFRATTRKRLVVLAPTGVAAVNVQGQTIHSFFGFRPDITVEMVRRRAVRDSALFKRLETMVIDEISMVRADLLDCVDTFLRLHGPEPSLPFGGVQTICIGDLYQLPPVVPPEEAMLFSTYYRSPYFFDAQVFQSWPLRVLELTRVFRQQDPEFVALLDAIRTCALDETQRAALNARVIQTPTTNDREFPMYLVPTNAQAERINAWHLARLSATAATLQGTVTGAFSEAALPTSTSLTLKPGARIMLLANDPEGRWVNGDLGTITALTPEQPSAAVGVELENGYRGRLGPYTWEMIRFTYDARHDRIEASVVGAFTQYPVRLAWALTIHKVQGKTFDHVCIDFGRGTFAHGQAYVALSRCTRLEGLELRHPIEQRHIFIDRRVPQFLARQRAAEA